MAGFGIKSEVDAPDEADYYFWGGAATPFFGLTHVIMKRGRFSHITIRFNTTLSTIEQIVDDANDKQSRYELFGWFQRSYSCMGKFVAVGESLRY